MSDLILTGASRGIGRAIAVALADAKTPHRLILSARDAGQLDVVAAQVRHRETSVRLVPGDLSTLEGASLLGTKLLEVIEPGSTLVHNAGMWPSRCERDAQGLERAAVVNFLAPLTMQRALLEAGKLARILVIGAGLMVKGRFDAERTPRGDDFSSLRTYANTKLALAQAMRDVAAAHPELDVLVMHPGVVRTDLGERPGLFGKVMSLVKKRWEAPEECGARVARVLSRERWSTTAGEAAWMFEERAESWPELPAGSREAVRQAVRSWLSPR